MVIPIIMPIATGGSGYAGVEVDNGSLDLPPLPKGWWWEVRDSGGAAIDIIPPVNIFLYGPHTYQHQMFDWCWRFRWIIRSTANGMVRKAQRNARLYGGQWKDFE
jgi:hypothetical protein